VRRNQHLARGHSFDVVSHALFGFVEADSALNRRKDYRSRPKRKATALRSRAISASRPRNLRYFIAAILTHGRLRSPAHVASSAFANLLRALSVSVVNLSETLLSCYFVVKPSDRQLNWSALDSCRSTFDNSTSIPIFGQMCLPRPILSSEFFLLRSHAGHIQKPSRKSRTLHRAFSAPPLTAADGRARNADSQRAFAQIPSLPPGEGRVACDSPRRGEREPRNLLVSLSSPFWVAEKS
jgi:hypothetical protein